MVITARFASVCPCCNSRIAVGSSQVRVAPSAPRPTSHRPWRPCGYPGCSRAYCDECDGEGLVLTASSGRSYRPSY